MTLATQKVLLNPVFSVSKKDKGAPRCLVRGSSDRGASHRDLGDQDRRQAHATGTLWPAFWQVPTPSSSFRSWPIRVTLVSTSGPLPISVAPTTGRVILPSSIR
jgi:hypothetical protein